MPSTEPSPRPWRAEQPGDECRFWTIRNPDGVSVCTAWRDADAALIVDAVNHIEETKRLSVKLYDPIRRAEAERDRLRDIVRRMADLSESLLANYEYRYREDANSMAFVENTRGFLREARAAIGEDAK